MEIKRGDVFMIGGRHKLMCADATNESEIRHLMDGEKAELLFTSPPYADMRSYGGSCDLSVEYLAQFIPAWKRFANFQAVNLGLKFSGGAVVEYWEAYKQAAKDCGLKLLAHNVWDKGKAGSVAQSTNMFYLTHEWLLVFGKERKRLNRTIPNDLKKYAEKQGLDFLKGGSMTVRQTSGKTKRFTTKTYTHHQIHSTTKCPPEMGSARKLHSATFPVALASQYIEAMANEREIVADCFAGSGTTLIAAEKLNRRAYLMEINPDYCRIILDRASKLPFMDIQYLGNFKSEPNIMDNYACKQCGTAITPPEILPPKVLGNNLGTFETVVVYYCPNCKKPHKSTKKGKLELSEIVVKQDKTGKC